MTFERPIRLDIVAGAELQGQRPFTLHGGEHQVFFYPKVNGHTVFDFLSVDVNRDVFPLFSPNGKAIVLQVVVFVEHVVNLVVHGLQQF